MLVTPMVNAATTAARLSIKALAAAGQFRAIALWLNEPLVPQGIYVQVQPDERPGCLRVLAEFDRLPESQHLMRYVCHLIWQLNSPLIEGIHLIARPVGKATTAWEHWVRVMTPALRSQLARQKAGDPSTPMPPAIGRRRAKSPREPIFAAHAKTLRAFMLTGSAVAAFAFGCLAEVLMTTARQEPVLPLQQPITQTEAKQPAAWPPIGTPETTDIVLMTNEAAEGQGADGVLSVSFQVQARRDRAPTVAGALEPVQVIEHDRLLNPADPTVTLAFGGDVDLDGLPYDTYETEAPLLSGLSLYQAADVAVVNLDSSLARAATSLEEKFQSRSRPEAVAHLRDSGVDLVNLTSEALLAFGEQGLSETLETLDRSGIYRVGAGRSEREARRPEILDVKGQRIAYLSYDRVKARPAHKSAAGVNAPDKQAILEDIQAVRDEVDWLVVNYRWPQDIPEQPADFQANLARLAIDQGADLVVGHHPSQLQGAELYKGRPIVYSLGDFVFGSDVEDTSAESAVLQVSLRDRQMKVDLIPVEVKDGQPRQLEAADATKVIEKLQSASKSFETPMPASIVLDMRPEPLPEAVSEPPQAPLPPAADSSPEVLLQTAPSAPAAEETGPFYQSGEEAVPFPEASVDGPDAPPFYRQSEPVPGRLDIEVEAIPDGLLDDWGPKEGSGTLYTPGPESPAEIPVEVPAGPPPSLSRQAETPAAETPAMIPAGAELFPEELAPTSQPDEPPAVSPGTISPHSEPLVGPLSAAPAQKKKPAITKAAQRMASTMEHFKAAPETRILQPLSSMESLEMESLEQGLSPADLGDDANSDGLGTVGN